MATAASKIKPPTPSERKALAEWAQSELAKQDLIEFCKTIDPRAADRYSAPHLMRMAEELEKVESGEIPRLFITAPPRHWKSSLVSEKFPLWYLAKHPDKSVGVFSHGAALPTRFSKSVKGNIDSNPRFHKLFPEIKLRIGSENSSDWSLLTAFRSSFRAFGVGTGPTGEGFDLISVDDPVADAAEAYSPTALERIWTWYKETLRDRLNPGGVICVVMCMVGDTPVLMADGTEKPLKDVRAGDMVATYDFGRLSIAMVTNWANQGSDLVFQVRTKSGKVITANKRHPFLVVRNGKTKWIILQHLKIGDTLLRASGDHCAALLAHLMDAPHQREQKDIASSITTKRAVKADTDRHRITQNHFARDAFVTGMELAKMNIRKCSPPKMDFVQSAEGHLIPMCVLIGKESSALTTTTEPEKCADSFATTATQQSANVSRKPSCSRPLNTSDFVPDAIVSITEAGREDVFDIEVKGTENFIANGIVSHNSRWHENDLAGRIMRESRDGTGEQWSELRLPAIAEQGDLLGRKPGEALWPAEWPLAALMQVKLAQGSRAFAARFQGSPKAMEGNLLDSTKLKMIDASDVPPLTMIVRRWDLAFSDPNAKADWSAGVRMGITADGRTIIIHVKRKQGKWPQVAPLIKSYADMDGVGCICLVEANGTQKGYADQMIDEIKNRVVESDCPQGSKEMRAAIWGNHLPDGNIYCVRGEWNQELFDEMDAFPNGTNDDMVDGVSGGWNRLHQPVGGMQSNRSVIYENRVAGVRGQSMW